MRLRYFGAAIVAVVLLAAPVLAHGDLDGTSPEDGARVQSPPGKVTITLTEAPTKGAEARVVDGCKDDVTDDVNAAEQDIVVFVADGAPGKWKVSYRAVSSVDGHQTRGSFTFTVAGKKDCSPAEEETDDNDVAGGEDTRIQNPNPPENESSNAWLLWVAGGTVVLAGAAWFVRRSAG